MFGLKNFLFGGSAASAALSDDVREALQAWQASSVPTIDEAHFHVRYVVVDVTTSGTQPEHDQLLGISAVGVQRGGAVHPDDAISLKFATADNSDAAGQDDFLRDAVDRQLIAFLQFTAKAPLVTYHSPYVLAFLQRAFKERLGIDFAPQTLDLAWLLPTLFGEKSVTPVPLDQWLEWFGMSSDGRRDTMANTLLLARLFQRLLVRVVGRDIDTAAKLLDESSASSFLRRRR